MCQYTLLAVVTLAARNVDTGHHEITFIDSSEADTFSDKIKSRSDIHSKLTDDTFMKTAYMAFYISNLAIQEKRIPVRIPFLLPTEETFEVKSLWFEDDVPRCRDLTSKLAGILCY